MIYSLGQENLQRTQKAVSYITIITQVISTSRSLVGKVLDNVNHIRILFILLIKLYKQLLLL